jgi:DNA replication protein DnaC
MELMHQLQPFLKQLRLSGILETLAARNQQAIGEQWTYVEFLARLLEDEVERRGQKQLTLRLRRAALNTTKTLEGFDFSFNPSLSRQRVMQLATCDCLERRLALYLRPHLLVLDDFGLRALSPLAAEDLYDVINERYERGSLMITSNRAPAEWPDLFANPLLASAGLDRLAHHAEVLVITGGSFRAQGRRQLEQAVQLDNG